MSKYRNVRTAVGDRTFASAKEAKRYTELRYAKMSGDCLWFLQQVPFHVQAGIKYVADFVVFWKDGKITIEDTKGFKTEVYKIKKKMVESCYPIKITEI